MYTNHISEHILSTLITTGEKEWVIIGTAKDEIKMSWRTDIWVKIPRRAALFSSPCPYTSHQPGSPATNTVFCNLSNSMNSAVPDILKSTSTCF